MEDGTTLNYLCVNFLTIGFDITHISLAIVVTVNPPLVEDIQADVEVVTTELIELLQLARLVVFQAMNEIRKNARSMTTRIIFYHFLALLMASIDDSRKIWVG